MIKHVMADGTVLDSVKGIVVPVTPVTEAAYRTVHEIIKRKTEKETYIHNSNKKGKVG